MSEATGTAQLLLELEDEKISPALCLLGGAGSFFGEFILRRLNCAAQCNQRLEPSIAESTS